jgi:hypothetical protein
VKPAPNTDWNELKTAMGKLKTAVKKRNNPKDAIDVIADIKHYRINLTLFLFFQVLSEVVNRFGIDEEMVLIVKSLERIISKNEDVKMEDIREVVRKLGIILQSHNAWDICTSGGHYALFYDAGFVFNK